MVVLVLLAECSIFIISNIRSLKFNISENQSFVLYFLPV